eukprot:TRINITY_DN10640_c0_g1_i1.p1 TRINITY_DN10640_c0_g1~~TRINITY_DN10640_c0_g1_i1.p1  ORF type:complete len:197 (+),score=57.04 TRINITY_DN10640_c0_g1_i1:144-734(+)
MFAKVATLALLVAVVVGQSIFVQATGSANSQNNVIIQQAVTQAIADINYTCFIGDDDDSLVDYIAAQKVVEAAATAIADGGINVISDGGSGSKSLNSFARSTAIAIAEAIAEAIADIEGGPSSAVVTRSLIETSETAVAAIEQAAQVDEAGNAVVLAAASSTIFVINVAEALAGAAAQCANGVGTITTSVSTNAAL